MVTNNLIKRPWEFWVLNLNPIYSKLADNQSENLIIQLKNELETQREYYEKELLSMKEERDSLFEELTKFKGTNYEESAEVQTKNHENNYVDDKQKINELEEEISSYKTNFDQLLNIIRAEDKNKEEREMKIKELNNEINEFKVKYEEVCSRLEKKNHDFDNVDKLNSEMRTNFLDLKPKYEEGMKINIKLKQKFLERESEFNNLSNNYNIVVKKLNNLQKRNEELEKEQIKYHTALNVKEQRMSALRTMNSKLEAKTGELIKKWEKLKVFEDSSSDIKKKFEYLYECIANLYKDNKKAIWKKYNY